MPEVIVFHVLEDFKDIPLGGKGGIVKIQAAGEQEGSVDVGQGSMVVMSKL